MVRQFTLLQIEASTACIYSYSKYHEKDAVPNEDLEEEICFLRKMELMPFCFTFKTCFTIFININAFLLNMHNKGHLECLMKYFKWVEQ